MVQRTLIDGLALLLVLLVGALLVGQYFGVPIVVGYVETDSMEPTLDPGDGYVAIPTAVAGPVETGDVVTYEAEQLHEGGLTTHRVVGETEAGYITKGDANPFTDQDNDEPYVTDGQVVAKAWQVDGDVVTIPHLGTVVVALGNTIEYVQFRLASLFGTQMLLGTQGLAYIFFGFGSLLLLSGFVESHGRDASRSRERDRSRSGVFDGRRLGVGLVVFVLVVTAGTMFLASGTEETGIVSAEFDSERPDVIRTGETETHERPIGNGGVLPMVVVLEPASEGVEIEESVHRVGHGEESTAHVSYTAPDETGYYLRNVAEYRYFGVLPTPLIERLHTIHPWIARATVTVTLVGPIAVLVALVFGTGRIRTRDRRRKRPGTLL